MSERAPQSTRHGYMTPAEFAEADAAWHAANPLSSFDRYPRGFANQSAAINAPPFSGDWIDYFNLNFWCGAPGFYPVNGDRGSVFGRCGSSNWKLQPSAPWLPKGGHTLRCVDCNAVYEVLVVAESPSIPAENR